MQGLLHWVLASPFRSGLVAAALALSRLFDIFGAAVISLVTLRKGAGAGLLSLAVALPLIVLASWAGGIGPGIVIAVLAVWLPVFLLSLVLRSTASQATMIQVGVVIAGVAVAAWFAVTADPIAEMLAFLEQQVLPLFEAMEGAPGSLGEKELLAMALVSPALIAAGTLLIATIAVFVGRWWQAMAFNPGGFRDEFHHLRHGRNAVLVMVALIVVAIISGHTVGFGFALAGIVALVIQGIAMVHGVVAASGQPGMWLWGMYGLIVLLPIPATVLLAIAGCLDNWMDFRRLAGQDTGKSNEMRDRKGE